MAVTYVDITTIPNYDPLRHLEVKSPVIMGLDGSAMGMMSRYLDAAELIDYFAKPDQIIYVLSIQLLSEGAPGTPGNKTYLVRSAVQTGAGPDYVTDLTVKHKEVGSDFQVRSIVSFRLNLESLQDVLINYKRDIVAAYLGRVLLEAIVPPPQSDAKPAAT